MLNCEGGVEAASRLTGMRRAERSIPSIFDDYYYYCFLHTGFSFGYLKKPSYRGARFGLRRLSFCASLLFHRHGPPECYLDRTLTRSRLFVVGSLRSRSFLEVDSRSRLTLLVSFLVDRSRLRFRRLFPGDLEDCSSTRLR